MGKRVLAIASAGGHWNQLMLMRPGYGDMAVTYLTTLPGLAEEFKAAPAHVIRDCIRDEPLAAAHAALQIAWHLIRVRPHVVLSTGALPGVIALGLGRMIGARTLWIDSVANAEELSASGRLARRIAHKTLSQWPAVADAEGVGYAGAIL